MSGDGSRPDNAASAVSLDDPLTDVPERWRPVVESTQYAEYARRGSNVVVEVSPVREGYRHVTRDRAPPTEYRVTLRRAFGVEGAERPEIVETAPTAADARNVARELMEAFNERLADALRRSPSPPFRVEGALDAGALARGAAMVRTAVDEGGYSRSLLNAFLDARFDDGVRALVHRAATGRTTRVRVAAGHADRYPDERLDALFEAYGGRVEGERSGCTVAEFGEERVAVIPFDAGATLLALDASAAVVLPAFTDDLRYLLARKWA